MSEFAEKFERKFSVLNKSFGGVEMLQIPKEQVKAAAEFVKNELGFAILLDIACVDESELCASQNRFNENSFNENSSIESSAFSIESKNRFNERFSVYYIFRKISGEKFCFFTYTDFELPSISEIYKSADWAEREGYDQFGIKFNGHKNLKRILNHKDFVGHPLRKDYSITKYQLLRQSDDLVDEMKRELAALGLSSEENDEFKTKFTFLNIGPSHPATHGTIRNFLALDGERICACVSEMGYLHRGFEKSAEAHNYAQIMPYTDRLNYCSALLNNIGYAKAVEEILGVEITERAKFMRVILGELSRIIDHEVCLAAMFVDMGALSNFWFLYNPREKIYSFLSKLTGARLTNSFARIGGMANDFHNGWEMELEACLKAVESGLKDAMDLIENNRIYLDRVQNVCKISSEDALSFGFSGPNLRASGVAYDLRKAEPYYYYDSFDFDIPLGSVGDIYDRMFVRFYEIKESVKIIRAAMRKIPHGEINIKDKNIILPEKNQVYNNIESLINHFKLIFDGIKVPRGSFYSASEGGNGELGFFIVSDGSGKPYRLKLRPPCFYALNAFSHMVRGALVADSILNLGSINIIAGELDR